jgi:phenylpropionate dioxygenase-like ring-hydroxylating dioxygenase large terminal subunit
VDHATQVALIERVLSNIDRNTTDMDEPSISPVERYLSRERFEAEMSVLFRQYPVLVGFASQIPSAGEFLTHDDTGVPILVNRDEKGRVNAFLNACRHRGTRLVDEPAGHGKAFVCPYHAWTYAQDGRLDHVTHAHGFPHVKKDDCGLIRLPVAERGGLIWVIPDPDGARDIDAYLGGMMDELEGFGFADHVLHRPHEDRRRANWKLTLDANLENYHVRVAHRDTIAFMFEDTVAAFDRFPPHMRLLLPKRSIRALRGSDPAGWSLRQHGNVIYFFFPNTMILVEPDHAMVMSVFPEGIDGYLVRGGMLVPEEPATEKAREYWRKNYEMFWNALDEDFRMVEAVQQGIGAGLMPHLHFARFEQTADWFHQEVEKAIGVTA